MFNQPPNGELEGLAARHETPLVNAAISTNMSIMAEKVENPDVYRNRGRLDSGKRHGIVFVDKLKAVLKAKRRPR